MIDPRLVDYCPPAKVVEGVLRKEGFQVSLTETTVNGQDCYKFVTNDVPKLSERLRNSRWQVVLETVTEVVCLNIKKKLLKVVAGTTFTVPADYKPLGTVLKPGSSYMLLRMSEQKFPVVVECPVELKDGINREYAIDCNEKGEGQELNFKEMAWVYRTALLNME